MFFARIVYYLYYVLKRAVIKYRNYQYRQIATVSKSAVIHDEASIRNLYDSPRKIIIGDNTHIRCDIYLYKGGFISIGRDCYIGENSYIWSKERISIGDRVLIGHNVNIMDNTTHPIDAKLRHQDYMNIIGITEEHDKLKCEKYCDSAPIIISDDSWIASNVTILKGIKIGEGAIVASGSVVTRNVEPHTMVAGNPARIVRKIQN